MVFSTEYTDKETIIIAVKENNCAYEQFSILGVALLPRTADGTNFQFSVGEIFNFFILMQEQNCMRHPV